MRSKHSPNRRPHDAIAATARQSPGLLRRLLWWSLDYAYAGLGQLRASLSRRSSGEFIQGTLRPVLVIPGVYEHWRFLLPLIRRLHRAGHPVHIIDPLRNNRVPVHQAAALVADYLSALKLHDVLIVAHSKGGLIGKHVMAFSADEQVRSRVSGMVAIATPFGGSRYARWFPARTLRAFSPRDATLAQLAADRSVNSRIVSVYPVFDPHIPEGSHLLGARNVAVNTGGHFRILAKRATREAVLNPGL